MNPSSFKTPKGNRIRSLVEQNSESPARKITVPASPSLERLGYGTGALIFCLLCSLFSNDYIS